jgi:hypothetical protein
MLSTTLLRVRGGRTPTPRAYRKRAREAPPVSTASQGAFPHATPARPCPPTHHTHSWCPTCRACRRHCTCGDAPAAASGSGSDAGPAGAGTGAGDSLSDCDGGGAGTESDSSSSAPRARLPSHKVIHGYASSDNSDGDGGNHPPPAYNTLATDAYDMGLTPAAQHAAGRSNTARHTTSVRDLSARALYYLLQGILALLVTFLQRWAPRDPGGLYWAARARLDKRYADDKQAEDDDVTATRILSAAASALQALPPRSRESRAIRPVLGAAGRRTLESGHWASRGRRTIPAPALTPSTPTPTAAMTPPRPLSLDTPTVGRAPTTACSPAAPPWSASPGIAGPGPTRLFSPWRTS